VSGSPHGVGCDGTAATGRRTHVSGVVDRCHRATLGEPAARVQVLRDHGRTRGFTGSADAAVPAGSASARSRAPGD
jgi:hypothetical protein